MNKTANYSLPHWEQSDRILMDDFNHMTEGIDAALTENKSAIEAAEASCNSAIEAVAAAAGNCTVTTGTYTGTGTYNTDTTAVKLTFAKRPILLLIVGGGTCAFIVNMTKGYSFYGTADSRSLGCYYSGTTAYWLSSGSAQTQMNSNGTTYTYFAFFM